MNRKFWISAVVMFVLASVLSYIAHEVLLKADYAKLGAMMRPAAEMQARLGYVVLAHVSFAFAFTWIYIKSKESRPWLAQGIRYGILIALVAVVPMYLIYHTVTPTPLDVAIKQIVYDGISTVILGALLAWINR
jgi:uncharacterized membrane protein YagU involved in acid resistance